MAHTGFTTAQSAIILERDAWSCAMCGRRAQVANHRANRGAGGYLAGNRLSNGCALCHVCNGEIESDPAAAAEARARGVKLSRYDDPLAEPYRHPLFRMLVLLDDAGGYRFV